MESTTLPARPGSVRKSEAGPYPDCVRLTGPYFGFPVQLIGVAKFMRLSLTKAAHADVANLRAQSDTQLPDGKQFLFWEKPFTPSMTHYVNGAIGNDENLGTQDRPFKTINKAALVLRPGERVLIASGVYREGSPAQGGTGPDKLISYEAAPGANVVISGAMVRNDWEPSTGSGYRGPQKGNAQIIGLALRVSCRF